jgi:hypothetical protein
MAFGSEFESLEVLVFVVPVLLFVVVKNAVNPSEDPVLGAWSEVGSSLAANGTATGAYAPKKGLTASMRPR